MGRFSYDGINDLIRDLDDLQIDRIAEKMLNSAAPILENSIKIKAGSHVETGSMVNSIKKTKVTKDSKGHHVTVRPTGTDSKGVRNMEKMAYLEYGTSKQKSTPVMAPAIRAAEKPVVKALQEAFDREVKDLTI